MCAEYTPGQPLEVEKLMIAIENFKNILRGNYQDIRIFPRDQAPIIRKSADDRIEMIDAEFSLIPKWWNPEKAEKKTKSGRPVFATHNARLESIHEKPTFKDSFQNFHCLVPIKSFFESSLFGNLYPGNRLKLTTGNILFAAGCYSEWINKTTGEVILSFTIVTRHPSLQIFEAGHDRMPVFLDLKAGLQWLQNEGSSHKDLKDFLLEKMLNGSLQFDITIDRPLKDSWTKNSPEASEIEELRKLLKKSS